MLWVYGHTKYFHFYSAGIDFRRQNRQKPTSPPPRCRGNGVPRIVTNVEIHPHNYNLPFIIPNISYKLVTQNLLQNLFVARATYMCAQIGIVIFV